MAGISKKAIREELEYEPHKNQLAVHQSDARFRIAAWGRRAGKSQVGGFELIPGAYLAYSQREWLKAHGKRHEYWIVGPEYSDAEKEFRVLWNALKNLEMPMDHPGSYNNVDGGQMSISLWNGLYQVHAKSAKYPGTLVGEGLKGLVLSEAAKLKRSVWEKYLRPTLADWRGWCYMGSTPEGKNWFWEMWRNGGNPSMPEYWSMRAPSWCNPYVYRDGVDPNALAVIQDALRNQRFSADMPECQLVDEEILSMVQGMSEELFNQEIAALFTEFTGRVFKEFDEEVHVAPRVYDPSLPLYAAADYGYTNPNVWLLIQVEQWGRVNILGEVYERQLTPEEFAEVIRARGLATGVVKFYGDPADPGAGNKLMQKLGIPMGGDTGGELNDRLELIRQRLRLPAPHIEQPLPQDAEPMLMIDPSCTNTIKDMLNYRYPETRAEAKTNSSELPVKKDDHAPEALGRFLRGHFGPPNLRRRRSRVRQANMRG